MNDVECFKCNNFGHKESECRSSFEYPSKSQNTWKPTIWKDKDIWKQEPGKSMEWGLALSSHSQETKWYVYNGFSKHMTKDNRKYMLLK